MKTQCCPECATAMSVAREDVVYDDCGLSSVMLKGVEVARCPACGEFVVAIRAIAKLHRAIADALIRKAGRLMGAEFRFLRKLLGWSGVDTAARFGVTKHTVSRWENDAEAIGPVADRLLRLLVATEAPIGDYHAQDLVNVANEPAAPLRAALVCRGDEWRVAA